MSGCIWNVKKEDRHCDLCVCKDCGERPILEETDPQIYIVAMSQVVGNGFLSHSRKSEYVWSRNMVAYQMFLDGFSQEVISKTLGKHRCTILYSIGKVGDMLKTPRFYKEEMRIWMDFQEMLSLQKR